jgi:hypothetical protein
MSPTAGGPSRLRRFRNISGPDRGGGESAGPPGSGSVSPADVRAAKQGPVPPGRRRTDSPVPPRPHSSTGGTSLLPADGPITPPRALWRPPSYAAGLQQETPPGDSDAGAPVVHRGCGARGEARHVPFSQAGGPPALGPARHAPVRLPARVRLPAATAPIRRPAVETTWTDSPLRVAPGDRPGSASHAHRASHEPRRREQGPLGPSGRRCSRQCPPIPIPTPT